MRDAPAIREPYTDGDPSPAMTRPYARWLTLAAFGGTLLAAAGCKEAEQNRVLFHEPGVYQGQEDAEIGDDTYQELRQRARRQAG
jgi:hypothetical protein